MATIPVVPSFVTGETPSIAKLNQLAACVTFVTVLPAYCALTASQTLTSASVTALTWTTVTDRDSGHSNGTNPARYTAQSPGYYEMSCSVTFAASSTGARLAYFQVTTGSGNPGGAGNTTSFGAKYCPASSPTRLTTLGIGMTSPYLYLGDYVEAYAYQNSGGGLSTATCYWELALVSLGP
jgi:hypothetical protein